MSQLQVVDRHGRLHCKSSILSKIHINLKDFARGYMKNKVLMSLSMSANDVRHVVIAAVIFFQKV